jgi:hypothetical protein
MRQHFEDPAAPATGILPRPVAGMKLLVVAALVKA